MKESNGNENIIRRKLILEDGSVYHGYGFGSLTDKKLELVFNTSMVGYQEILSDPSYTDQAVVMTYPVIGNYGINDDDFESGLEGGSIYGPGALIVRDYTFEPSNFRCSETLSDHMAKRDIAGIYGVDTRQITRKIRDIGSCKVMITGDSSVDDKRSNENKVEAVTSNERVHSEVKSDEDALVELRKWNYATDQVSRVSSPQILEVGFKDEFIHKYSVKDENRNPTSSVTTEHCMDSNDVKKKYENIMKLPIDREGYETDPADIDKTGIDQTDIDQTDSVRAGFKLSQSTKDGAKTQYDIMMRLPIDRGETYTDNGSYDPVSNISNYHVVAIDCGIKSNIVRQLRDLGCRVTLVPYDTTADDIMALQPDGVFISNGPGDPTDVQTTINTVRSLHGKYPIFGICLGHQILALSYGASTYKLKFGHRGGNHPVKNIETGKVDITSQNHSYAVDKDSLTGTGLKVTHINILDDTVEGIEHIEDPSFGIQYHPESAPGPNDSRYLFLKFTELMKHRS